MYTRCTRMVSRVSKMLVVLAAVAVVFFCAFSTLGTTAYAYDLDNGGHFHQHIFSCYEGWETICREDHIHYANCYRGKGELVCGMENGKYYTVAQMESLREKSIFVTSVKSCRIPERNPILDAITKRPSVLPSSMQKGDKWQYKNLPHIARDDMAIVVKLLETDTNLLHKHTEDCYQDVYLFRARFL